MVLSEKKHHTLKGSEEGQDRVATRSSTRPSSGRTQLPGARHAVLRPQRRRQRAGAWGAPDQTGSYPHLVRRTRYSGTPPSRSSRTQDPTMYWPDVWKHMSDAAKRKAKQKWAIEKPKLDSARQLRGIFFIELEDENFKNIMKKRS